jgi:hypothetical protein
MVPENTTRISSPEEGSVVMGGRLPCLRKTPGIRQLAMNIKRLICHFSHHIVTQGTLLASSAIQGFLNLCNLGEKSQMSLLTR